MKYLFFVLLGLMLLPRVVFAQVIDITFPVDGQTTFTDDFNDQRAGHIHHATDMIAAKMTPVLAAADGQIDFAPMAEPSYGYMITLNGDDGYTYNYVHLNNDTPGTDDGAGGTEHAYAPGIEQGTRVTRGEHIAWVGDSGNAESVGSHLHFEIYDGKVAINPYESLLAAQGNIGYDFDPAGETARATSINEDQEILPADGLTNCTTDSLIRTQAVSTVYYCGRDGGRYVFQNEGTFFSWFSDFSNVKFVTPEVLASIQINGVVTYKPGASLIKIPSVPKVYAVGHNGTLRWITSPSMAEELYGANWSTFVRDLSEGFFPAYTVGAEILRT